MKSWKLLPLLTAFTLVMAAQANAQTTDVDGSFDNLSTGNQKIATALYDAQGDVEGVEGAYTLDDIAGMKQDGTGWGQMFKQLQADGHIPEDVKNLGQLVSGRYQATGDVTTESGSETGTTDAATTEAGTNAQTTEIEGSFDSLSTGNQKIATALYDAQGDVEGVEGAYTLDDIAGMKQDGTGWGRLFQDLQADHQIPDDIKNLGELVSGRYQATGDVTTESGTDTGGTDTGGTDTVTTEFGAKTQGGSAPGAAASGRGKGTIVITTAGGGQIVVERGSRRGQGAGATGTAKTTGGGAGQGHGKGGSHSVTVTTAGGGSVSVGGGKANGLGHGKGGVTVSTAGGGSLGGGQGGVKVAGGGGQGRGAGPKK